MKLDEEDDDDYDDELNVFNQLKPLTKRRQVIICVIVTKLLI
jgi:hypothetical protein